LSGLSPVTGSEVGPYGGSRATAQAFGARLLIRPANPHDPNDDRWLAWRGGLGNIGGWSYTALVASWMTDESIAAFILSPDNNYIGFGSTLGGTRGVLHYLLLSGRI